MEIKTYSCTTEKSVKKYTILFSTIVFAIPITHYYITNSIEVINIVIVSILFVVWAIIYSLAPKKVVMYRDKIVIERLFKNFAIPISSIVAVTQNEKSKFLGDSRRFAVVGLFGYYGYFRSRNYGNYYCISNNSQNNIFLMTTKGSFQISCNNPTDAVLNISSLINKCNINN